MVQKLLPKKTHKYMIMAINQSAVLKWEESSPRAAARHGGTAPSTLVHFSGLRLGSIPKILVGWAAHGDENRAYSTLMSSIN